MLNYSLSEVVYEWAKGTDFAEVCSYFQGEIQEGQVIRTIQRLENLLKDFRSACKMIGNIPLFNLAE